MIEMHNIYPCVYFDIVQRRRSRLRLKRSASTSTPPAASGKTRIVTSFWSIRYLHGFLAAVYKWCFAYFFCLWSITGFYSGLLFFDFVTISTMFRKTFKLIYGFSVFYDILRHTLCSYGGLHEQYQMRFSHLVRLMDGSVS